MKKKIYIIPLVGVEPVNTPLLRVFEPSVLDNTDSNLHAPERQPKAF